MLTERMRKIELHVLHRDVDAVLEYLGTSSCIQIDPTSLSASDAGADHDTHARSPSREDEQRQQIRQAELARRLNELRGFFLADSADDRSTVTHVAGSKEVHQAERLCKEGETLLSSYRQHEQRINSLKGTLEEVSAFSRLDMPFKEIENLTFLTLRFGVISEEKRQAVEAKLAGRAVLIPLDASGRVLAAASKKGRFAMDSDLKNAGFQETALPTVDGVPSEVVLALHRELADEEKRLGELGKRNEDFASRFGTDLLRLCRAFSLANQINEVKHGLSTTRTVYRLSGWVPQSLIRTTIRELETRTESRIAIRLYTPGELPSVRSGVEMVPVKLNHSGLVRSFERMVFSYGAPLYGTIDPTPLVAFLFILLFAIMFGDVGQGLVGVAAGIIFIKGRKILGESRWQRWHNFGPIFIAVGIASAFTGLLYGSVFSNEALLVPASRALTGALFGAPRDRIISLMPEGGLDRIFIFFGFTLALGIVINSIGLFINIFNQLMLRRYFHALLTKTGLTGALFFWYAIFIGIRILTGGHFASFDLIVLFVPLLLLFWAEPIYRVLSHEKPVFPDGLLSFAVGGFVEILESVSYYLSNSLSFLRVAAFALSHTVLSLITFKIVELLHGTAGAVVLQPLVVIVFNVLIIFLEGLIVSIQVIRLQYYEFFSKFFTETGVEFHPFALRSDV